MKDSRLSLKGMWKFLELMPKRSTGTFGRKSKKLFDLKKIGLVGVRLFPILVSDVDMCVELLKFKGVDAFKGVSQMSLVEPPIGSRYKYPAETFKYIENVSFRISHVDHYFLDFSSSSCQFTKKQTEKKSCRWPRAPSRWSE